MPFSRSAIRRLLALEVAGICLLLVAAAVSLADDPDLPHVARSDSFRARIEAVAAAPVWPLEDLPRYLTSNFMEYRSGRFHAGLDLKTNSRCGYAVFAAEDGWISRARTAANGYGKAVYLRGDSGLTYVYAHLERFADPIAASIRSAQERQGRYSVDLYQEEGRIAVRRGQVLGLSGQSATSGPHLHFEVRDGRQRPLNPLAHGFAVQDSLAPRIYKLRALPAEAQSRVEGELVAHCLQSEGGLSGELPALTVSGAVAFSARIVDTADIRAHRLEPFSIRVSVNGRVVFSRRNDVFAYGDGRLMQLEWLIMADVRELWLDLRPGNRLPGRDGAAWSRQPGGLPTGRHRVQITAEDFSGNAVSVAFDLIVAAAGERPGRDSAARWRIDPVRLALPCSAQQQEHWLTPFLETYRDREGAWHAVELSRAAGAQSDTALSREAIGARLGAAGGPQGLLVLPVGPEMGDPLLLPTAVWIAPDSLNVMERGRARRAQGLEAIGPAVKYIAADWLATGGVRLPFPGGADSLVARTDVGVFRQDARGRWQWAGSYAAVPEVCRERSLIAVAQPGRYALFADVTPPYLGRSTSLRVSLAESRNRSGVSLPRWEILPLPAEDAGSGLDAESCRISLDGRSLIAEPDLPRRRFLVELPDSVTIGEHALTMQVGDRAGRASSRTWQLSCQPREEGRSGAASAP